MEFGNFRNFNLDLTGSDFKKTSGFGKTSFGKRKPSRDEPERDFKHARVFKGRVTVHRL